MVGKTFTYLLGSDAAALLFNSKNEDLNAEDVYSRLTTPVFGKGVAYDVPNVVCILNMSRKVAWLEFWGGSPEILALCDGVVWS